MKKITALLMIVALASLGVTAVMALEPNTVTYTGQGFTDGMLDSEKCGPDTDLGQDKDFVVGPDGAYLKWVLTAAGADSATITGPWGTFDMIPVPGGGGVFHKATDYYPVDVLTAFPVTATWVGDVTGNVQLVVSNGCSGDGYEELTVSKTAVTSFTREHFWAIDKSVDTEFGYMLNGYPKIWLFIDGSGDETATWTVDVTYEGYEDSDFNVSGVITIENTGTLDAVITAVDDVLSGMPILVDCDVTFPYTLPVGETLTCTYDKDVDSKIEGFNEVTVTTERDTYFADTAIVWGDPTTEINKTVNIKDLSDLFGEVDLGTVTAPNDAQFTYTKDFAWADYGPGETRGFTYHNTATIVETGQSASATLKVNVQGYEYETAYAKGDDAECFIDHGFSQWGWTNPIIPGEYTWDLWAGAAQCDTDKGTLVGSVTVVYDDDGYVTVTYNVDAPYSLDETHVYADYTKFPKDQRGRDTVAPGRYYNASPFDGSQVHVIAHAVVGIPDPDFGP